MVPPLNMKTSARRFALASVCALLFAFECAWALDLTPVPGFRELEGFRIRIVQFSDGTRKINYQPPGNWNLSGGGRELKLIPPDVDQASMRFVLVEKKAPGALDAAAAAAEDLQAWAMQFIPAGSKDVAFVSKTQNPFLLEGHSTDEFIFTYSLYGSRETISISVVDRTDTERMVVAISARTKDFEPIHKAGIASMFSWLPGR